MRGGNIIISKMASLGRDQLPVNAKGDFFDVKPFILVMKEVIIFPGSLRICVTDYYLANALFNNINERSCTNSMIFRTKNYFLEYTTSKSSLGP